MTCKMGPNLQSDIALDSLRPPRDPRGPVRSRVGGGSGSEAPGRPAEAAGAGRVWAGPGCPVGPSLAHRQPAAGRPGSQQGLRRRPSAPGALARPSPVPSSRHPRVVGTKAPGRRRDEGVHLGHGVPVMGHGASPTPQERPRSPRNGAASVL